MRRTLNSLLLTQTKRSERRNTTRFDRNPLTALYFSPVSFQKGEERMPEPLVRLTREREPGTPWELGDRLTITFIDERGRELEGVGFVCTAHQNGRIIEAVSERLPLMRLTFSASASTPDLCDPEAGECGGCDSHSARIAPCECRACHGERVY